MSETGRRVHTHGMDDNAAMSPHRMKIQTPHRVYGMEPETFAVQATLEPTDHGVDHGQEVVGGTTVPETLVNDRGLCFKITREHGIHELLDEIDLWVGKVHIVAPMAETGYLPKYTHEDSGAHFCPRTRYTRDKEGCQHNEDNRGIVVRTEQD